MDIVKFYKKVYIHLEKKYKRIVDQDQQNLPALENYHQLNQSLSDENMNNQYI